MAKLFTPLPIGTSSNYPLLPPPTGTSSKMGTFVGASTDVYAFTGALVAFLTAFFTAGLGTCPY